MTPPPPPPRLLTALALNTAQLNLQLKSDCDSVQEKKNTAVCVDEQHKEESVMCSLDDDKVVPPLALLRVMEFNVVCC